MMWENYNEKYPYGRYLSEIEGRAIRFALAQAQHPSAALEIGSEAGRWSAMMAQQGWQMTCTDVSSEALAICQQRIPTARCVLVQPADDTLPCETGSQGLVLCMEVGQVIQSHWILGEVDRVLAPGGLFVGFYWNSRSPRGLAYKYIPSLRAKQNVSYFTWPITYLQWRRQLREAGFTMLREEGAGWIPFRRFGMSSLVPLAARIEQVVGLRRAVGVSPVTIFVARKGQATR